MKQGTEHSPELCASFHHAIELIGRRWTGAILFLLLKERCRFATLRDAIPEITDRMLSDRLRDLEAEGIVERTVVPDTPVRVEYAITKKGRDLAATFDAISAWAHKWAQAPGAEPHISRVASREWRVAGKKAGGGRGESRPATRESRTRS